MTIPPQEFRESSPASLVRPPSAGPILLALMLLIICYLWPLFAPLLHSPGGMARMGGDIVNEFYPNKSLLRSNVLAGHLPLRDPYTFSGVPFLANCQISALFYPDVAMWLLLPLRWGFAVDQALHLFLAGAGMAALTLFYTRSLPAAFTAAATFVCGSFFGSKVFAGHLPLMQTMAWLPWIMLCYEKALVPGRFSRWSLAAGALLAVAILAGYPEIDLIILVAIAARFLWEFPAVRSRGRAALIANTLAPVFLGLCLAAVQLLPTLELVSQSQRFATDYATIKARSLPLVNLVTLLLPDALGNAALHNTVQGSFSFDTAAYTGVMALILGGAALYVLRDRRAGFYGALAALGLFLSLGGYNPVYRLIWDLPGFHQVAMPARFLCLWVFALPVLAGFGVQTLLTDGVDVRRLATACWASLCVASASVLAWVAFQVLHVQIVAEAQRAITARYPVPGAQLAKLDSLLAALMINLTAFAVLSLLGMGLLFASRRAGPGRRTQLAWAAAALTVCDLFLVNTKYISAIGLGNPDTPTSYMAALTRDAAPYRVLPLDNATLGPESFLLTRTQSVLGYDPIISAEYLQYLAAADAEPVSQLDSHTPNVRNYNSPLLDRLNVRYVLSSKALADPSLVSVPSGGSTYIYRRTHAAPRAYLVDTVEVQPDTGTALDRLRQTSYDQLATVTTSVSTAAGSSRPEPMPQFTEPTPEQVHVDAAPNSDTLLVIGETYGPGWEAKVDGRLAPVLKADVVLCGVPLTAGHHLVDLQYHPRSLQVGATISLASLLALGCLTLGLRRRRAT